MNYAVLKTELADPVYTGLSDADAAAALNAQTVATFQKVEYSDVASYLMLVEKYLPISESATASGKAFMLAMSTFQTFDLRKPGVETAVVNLLDALIVDGLITASDKAAILALADDTISRAQELGLPVVRPGHVETARAI
jgi:hypothetical protein